MFEYKKRATDNSHLHIGNIVPTGQTTNVFFSEAGRRSPVYGKDSVLEVATVSEEIGLDSLFLADNWSGHQRAAEVGGHQSPIFYAPLHGMALAAVTKHIGIITTIHTTYHDPAHIARMGATLDAFSGGRWGWNIVTGFHESVAGLFGLEPIEHDERYAMAYESIEVVKKFWAEPDEVDHQGKYYTARGRVKAPRPDQKPFPFLVNAGASPAGMRFAARDCDWLVALGATVEQLRSVQENFSKEVHEAGRSASEAAIVPFANCLIRDGDGEAEEEWANLEKTLDKEATIEIAGDIVRSVQSMTKLYSDTSLDDAVLKVGGGGGMLRLVGTPAQVAEQLITCKQEAGIGGVLISNLLWGPEEVRRLGQVLPLLREAGIWTAPEDRGWSW